MILAKATAGTIRYLLSPGSAPSSVTWSLYDPEGNAHLTGQSATVPTAYAVTSGAENAAPDDVTLTCGTAPTQIASGDIARITDTWGRQHDGICYGRSGVYLRVADVAAAEVLGAGTVYDPEIRIAIPGAELDATGDGWRLDLVIVRGGVTSLDTLWVSVGLYVVDIDVSPREVIDRHPEIRSDLAHVETRRDWPRITARARREVEKRILAQKLWYTQIVSPDGLRDAVAAACWMLLAASYVPDGQDPGAWIDRARSEFAEAVSECLAGAHVDRDLDGKITDDEASAPARTSYQAR